MLEIIFKAREEKLASLTVGKLKAMLCYLT